MGAARQRTAAAAMSIWMLFAGAAAGQASAGLVGPSVTSGQAIPSSGVAYDLTSRITARTYRIFLYVPPAPPPPSGFPVVYLLDGNWTFATAVQTARLQGGLRASSRAIIVGIGYPTDDYGLAQTLRAFDLTAPDPSGSRPAWMSKESVAVGGAEGFRRSLFEEIRPFVEARAKVDRACQTLYGHSLGGFFVLDTLFKAPDSFRTYVAASPSIWWSDRTVLVGEAAFRERLSRGEFHGRLMMTVGAREEAGVDGPYRMIGNVRELSERLRRAGGPGFVQAVRVLENESHGSSIQAAVSKTLRFGLCPGDANP